MLFYSGQAIIQKPELSDYSSFHFHTVPWLVAAERKLVRAYFFKKLQWTGFPQV